MSYIDKLSSSDLIVICQKFYTEKCQRNGEKIKIISYETKPLSEVPCGFLSEHNILTMHFESDDEVKFTVEFFVKSVVQSLTKYVEEYGVFEKEFGVFNEIIPKLAPYSTIRWAPLCYLARHDVLVFENLRNVGFEMITNNDGVFDHHQQLVALELLAAMHASSIVYEKRNGKIDVQTWFHYLKENVYPSDSNAMKTKTHVFVVDTLAELVKRIPKYQDQMNKILPEFRKLMHRMKDFVKPSNHYRNVFSHGDLWSNNCLFKYGFDMNHHIPVAAILVDFQLARYAPPALDLMVMLTITSNSEYRQKFLMDLCGTYYDYLTSELKNHSIDIEQEYPRQQFDESCTFYRIVGLMESCFFSHMTLLPNDLLLTVNEDPEERNKFMTQSKTDVCLKAFDARGSYCSRMSDMLMELIDVYVLPKLS